MGVYSFFSFIFVIFDEGLKFFSPSAILYHFSGSFVLNSGKKTSSRHKNSPRKNATVFFAPAAEISRVLVIALNDLLVNSAKFRIK